MTFLTCVSFGASASSVISLADRPLYGAEKVTVTLTHRIKVTVTSTTFEKPPRWTARFSQQTAARRRSREHRLR